MGWILNIAVFAAKMQRMLSAHPGQRVVEDPGRPPGVKVSRASIAVIFAETDARSVRVIVDAGDQRELAQTIVTRGVELCGMIEINWSELIQASRFESVRE